MCTFWILLYTSCLVIVQCISCVRAEKMLSNFRCLISGKREAKPDPGLLHRAIWLEISLLLALAQCIRWWQNKGSSLVLKLCKNPLTDQLLIPAVSRGRDSKLHLYLHTTQQVSFKVCGKFRSVSTRILVDMPDGGLH
jgi:hypothetical protein